MTSPPPIDGNLLQVLEDLSKDPKAHLFLTTPSRLLTGLRDGSLNTKVSRTGLRPVERHLLQVHRHEAAWLLRDAFLRSFAQDSQTKNVFVPGHPMPLALHRNRVDWLSTHLNAEMLLRPEIQVLRSSARPGTEHGLPTNLALITASLELDNAENARVYAAYEFHRSGQPHSALRIARTELRHSVDPEIRMRTGQLMGLCYLELGEFEAARASYLYASRWAQRAPSPESGVAECLLNVMTTSLRSGQLSEAQAASEHVERMGLKKDLIVPIAKRVRASLMDYPISAARNISSAMLGSCGPTARLVLDANI